MDQENITRLCGEVLEEALNQLNAMRAKEGKHLREDLELQTPASFNARFAVDVRARAEAVNIEVVMATTQVESTNNRAKSSETKVSPKPRFCSNCLFTINRITFPFFF